MTVIVCYTGGTCGDLLSALIDPQDACVLENGTVLHVPERVRLKKPHLFASDDEKDQYIRSVEYRSISSHDTDYHVRQNHPFLSVRVQSMPTAIWAANRFKSLHREHVWAEMQRRCGADNIKDYAQTLIDYGNMIVQRASVFITMEEILKGSAIEFLVHNLNIEISCQSKDIYDRWLSMQMI